MNIYVVLTRLMFLGLFPLSIFWLRRAWLIGIKKDYSYVALKKGLPPENPKKYAIFSLAINLIAGLIFAAMILLVIIVGLDYEIWTAVVGTTLWTKLFIEFILSRHAHMKK
ncbi:MAG: hypothetical protein KAQ68_00410 [Clostridiales bacterium]|nr:hypothetical protein [Clostridiales bacterium]